MQADASIGMEFDTRLHYKNENENWRTKIINWFNSKTPYADFHRKISEWKPDWTFYIEIKDRHHNFVDFDKNYLSSYQPYAVHQHTQNDGAQPTTSTVPTIELRVVRTFGNHRDSTVNDKPRAPNAKRSMVEGGRPTSPNSVGEQPRIDRLCTLPQTHYCFICAPYSITINYDNSSMRFTTDLNDTQRDQYQTDKINAATGQRTGCLVCLQGDKKEVKGNAKHNAFLPKLRVLRKITSIEEKDPGILRIYLVNEICENGTRTLYHHPQREFAVDNNETANRSVNINTEDKNEPEENFVSIPLNDQIYSKEGTELKLKATAILHAKTHSLDQKNLFCPLTNRCLDGTNYETSRLACVRERGGQLLWDEILLSKPFIFRKSKDTIGIIDIEDNNDQIVEQIPVRIMKRKMNLNQSAMEYAPKIKAHKQLSAMTTVSAVHQQTLITTSMNNYSNTTTHNQQTITPTTNILHQQQDNVMTSETEGTTTSVTHNVADCEHSPVTTANNLANSSQDVFPETLSPTLSFLQDYMSYLSEPECPSNNVSGVLGINDNNLSY